MYQVPQYGWTIFSIYFLLKSIGQPTYKEIERGETIYPHELEAIKRIAFQVYWLGVKPMTKDISEGIKQQLGGEWFSFANPANNETYEFSLTTVKGTDFVSFVLNDTTKFQVCRIKAY